MLYSTVTISGHIDIRMPKFLDNLFSLYLVHAARLILPLVLMPILARRVDADAFSMYLYITSFISWCTIFIEYGFNLSSTRGISRLNESELIANIVSTTQSARTILAIASIATLPLALYTLQPFQDNLSWLVCGWLATVFTGLLPLYYFLGIEKMRPVAALELITGLAQFIGILALVIQPEHAPRIPYILLAARSATLLIAYYLMLKNIGHSALTLNLRKGVTALRKGMQVFTYQALSSLYTSFNIVLLGLFVGIKEVAIYAAAEKLVRAGLGFITHASNALFPRMSRLQNRDKTTFYRDQKLALWAFIGIGLAGCTLTIITAPYIIPWFYDNKFNDAIHIIKILSGAIPAIAISNVLGFQFLLANNKENILSRTILTASACNLLLAYLLVEKLKLGATGMAYCWLTIEWIVAATLTIYILLTQHHRHTAPARNHTSNTKDVGVRY
jgi:polysaccharide transporter, PST family